jgi:hypothetical protein
MYGTLQAMLERCGTLRKGAEGYRIVRKGLEQRVPFQSCDVTCDMARQHGHLSTQALTCTRLKRAVQHGCVACTVADIRRPSAVYGHVGIKNSQQRQWRGFSIIVATGALQWLLLMSTLLLLYRTCFWAGDMFALKLHMCDGVPIQRFLQDTFLDMWETVMCAICDLDGVLGFGVRCLTSC